MLEQGPRSESGSPITRSFPPAVPPSFASMYGESVASKLPIRRGSLLLPRGPSGETLFHALAISGNECPACAAVVTLLKDYGVDINAALTDGSNGRPLDVAAARDSGYIAMALIIAGADTSPRPIPAVLPLWKGLNYAFSTYLHDLAANNAADVIRVIIAREIELGSARGDAKEETGKALASIFRVRRKGHNDTPLLAATVMNAIGAAETLLEYLSAQDTNEIMNVNVRPPKKMQERLISMGHTALANSSHFSHAIVSPRSVSPMSAAVDAGYPKMLVILLNKGGDPNQEDSTKKALINHAFSCAEADIGQYTVHFALEEKPHHEKQLSKLSLRLRYVKCARKLAKAGAKVTGADYYGHSVIHYAVASRDPKSVKTILRLGGVADVCRVIEPKGTSEAGYTPLMRALSHYNYPHEHHLDPQHTAEMVKNLLEFGAGASIDVRDGEGRTALHHAASNGFSEAARLLVSAGASLAACDNAGRTARNVFMAYLIKNKIPQTPLLLSAFEPPAVVRTRAGPRVSDLD
jgi:ankyrin repeat protein